MVRNIILGLVVVALVALGYVAYLDMKAKRSLLSGEVFAGPSEAANGSSPQLSGGSPAAGNAVARPTAYPAAAGTPAASDVSVRVPAGDTISPNPPNGMVFAGSGRFQVYRQGNITWRVDTVSGTSCILFATNEEWRKAQVYQNGCGSAATR
jgi:hypothetical protein